VLAALRSRRASEAAIVVGLAALWGANYVLIGIAVKELDPAFLSCVRSLIGGAFLVAWRPQALASTWTRTREHPVTMVSLAAIAVSLPIWLIGVAEHQGVSAGATAVILALSPALIAVSAPLVDHSERLNPLQWLGVVLATVGVAVVVGSATAGLGSWIGLVAISVATIAYAASSIFAKLRCETWPSIDVAVGTLLIGGLLLIPPAAGTLPGAMPSLEVIIAMALLSVVGTGLSMLFLFGAIKFGGAGFSLRPVYLSPAFSVIGGAWFLDEPVTQGLVIGFLVTCVGVALSISRLPEIDERPS